MREWEIGAVENIHGALPYIRFAPILALVGVGVNRIGKIQTSAASKTQCKAVIPGALCAPIYTIARLRRVRAIQSIAREGAPGVQDVCSLSSCEQAQRNGRNQRASEPNLATQKRGPRGVHQEAQSSSVCFVRIPCGRLRCDRAGKTNQRMEQDLEKSLDRERELQLERFKL